MSKCLGLSLSVHLAVLATLPMLASMIQVKRPCPMVIDFTIESCPPSESRRAAGREPAVPVRKVAAPTHPVVVPNRTTVPVRQPEKLAKAAPAEAPVAQTTQAAAAPANVGSESGTKTETTGVARGHGKGVSVSPPATDSGSGENGSAESAKQRYLKEHFSYIRDLVAKRIIYPAVARRMGWAGRVVVAFTIMEDGTADYIRLVQSSGISLLDKSALETVRRASPFPRPPVRAEIVIPVLFKLL